MIKDLFIIAAQGKNRIIGNNGKIPWHISADLRRFKAMTYHHPIIMGHNTYKSIGKVLYGRKNIIMSRTLDKAKLQEEIIKEDHKRQTIINSEVASDVAALNAEVIKLGDKSTIHGLKNTHSNEIVVCNTKTEALEECLKVGTAKNDEDRIPYVIGGRQIYKLFLPFASKLFITLVYDKPKGDVRFPTIKKEEFELIDEREGEGLPKHTYLIYQRIFNGM